MTAQLRRLAAASRCGRGIRTVGSSLTGIGLCLLLCSSAAGHGWHNAALATASLDEWTADVREAIPEIRKQLDQAAAPEMSAYRDIEKLRQAAKNATGEDAAGEDATSPTGGPGRAGTILTDLTPEQRALLGRKAQDCLEIIAYMEPDNIIPEEFPRFKLQNVPQYRKAAKELMKAMGSAGTEPLVGVIQNEMAGPGRSPLGMKWHPDYYKDLLEILQSSAKSGQLSDEAVKTLLQASQGRKSKRQQAFADKVQDTVLLENYDLATMIDVVEKTEDRRLKSRLNTRIRKRIEEADVLELLECQRSTDSAGLKRTVAAQLKRTTPKFREIEPQLDQVWKIAGGDDQQAAQAARRQVVNAFLQAGIPDCMDWIGRGDPQLGGLIWEQLDFRVLRAKTRGDTELLGRYRRAGVAVLSDSGRKMPSRTAAIEFLARLKDRQAVGPISQVMPQLPRELWPKVGKLLHGLTGQDYGPHEGDDAGQAFEAMKKWRRWSEENSAR